MSDIPIENKNVVWVGEAGFEAHHDKIIVLQDDYRSGFECPKCLDKEHRTWQGKEVSVVQCETCKGEGKRAKAGNADILVKCTECEGMGVVACPDCQGRGGTIVLAENTKGRPTTGTIVSVGPDTSLTTCQSCRGQGKRFEVKVANLETVLCENCKGVGKVPTWKLGDKCIYPSYAGNAYDLKEWIDGKPKDVILVILRDEDINSHMYGKLESSQVKRVAALHTNA